MRPLKVGFEKSNKWRPVHRTSCFCNARYCFLTNPGQLEFLGITAD